MAVATRTYRESEEHSVLTRERIQETGRSGLVEILGAGGYVRYDFSAATGLRLLRRTRSGVQLDDVPIVQDVIEVHVLPVSDTVAP